MCLRNALTNFSGMFTVDEVGKKSYVLDTAFHFIRFLTSVTN